MEELRENRKIRYTKTAIKESLYELLERKMIHQITVKELCELADISRSTFYAHYTDICDLVNKLESQIINISQDIIDLNDIVGNTYKAYLSLFSNIKENVESYRLVWLNPGSSRCFVKLKDKIQKHHMSAMHGYNTLSESHIDYIYEFYSQGCMQVIYKWVKSGMKESPEEMAELMSAITKSNFS